jgi:hypothetical protein
MSRQAEMAMQSAGERVRYDATTLATSALSAAKEAGAFDAVASAMMIAIAAVVRHERGPDALDELLDLAAMET